MHPLIGKAVERPCRSTLTLERSHAPNRIPGPNSPSSGETTPTGGSAWGSSLSAVNLQQRKK